jgi:tight adherence protein B
VVSRAGATAIVLGAVAAVVSFGVRSGRRRRHREILRTQFADSIASLASSMSAGNSFLRSFQQLEVTSVSPLRPHLAHTLNEVDLGEPVSIAVESMARRTQLVEAAWLAHVLRVQELTGSPIAALLQELAALVRQTDSLQREIRALTAEGRISAYVIAALPLALAAILSATNPGYLDPFSHGWGLAVTVGMVAAICGGLLIMSVMVRSVEV